MKSGVQEAGQELLSAYKNSRIGNEIGGSVEGFGNSGTKNSVRTERIETTQPDVPEKIYRGAREGNIKDVSLRPGEDAVSFRDSLSNPLPEVGQKPQPVLRPGEKYIEVDTNKLPPSSVIIDGGTKGLPPGHVSVKATPQEIINATEGGGKFPNLTEAEKEYLRARGLR